MQRSRTITRDTTRRSKNNESSTNARTTKDHQSSDPEQISGPAEKSTPSNLHLEDGDMKEAEGSSNNATRPQQQELLATDGDDEDKCKEQKALSHLG
jgi:hypothetical protein